MIGLIIITGIFALCLALGLMIKEEEPRETLVFIGVVGLILIGGFGWGLYGSCTKKYVIITKLTASEISYSSTRVFVTIDDEVIEYDTKKEYDNIDSTTVFYHVEYFNIYKCNTSGGTVLGLDELDLEAYRASVYCQNTMLKR